MNNTNIPLCVDLDGSLCKVDTLHEGLLNLCRQQFGRLSALPDWLRRGKAYFKDQLSAISQIDVALLPYNQELIEWLKEQRRDGRLLVLATASHKSVAESIAQHLGLFDEVIASDATSNLSGERKRQALVARFGEQGFDYVGNSSVDIEVWRSARAAIVVGDSRLRDRVNKLLPVAKTFTGHTSSLKIWVNAMRLHQWIKNALIFLPAILSHKILHPDVLIASSLAFFSYGLCASSVYITNDLLDLSSDRKHSRKRNRPFASGKLSALSGVVAALLSLTLASVIAIYVGWMFCVVLTLYYIFTWAYSLRLKRAAIVDVMTLAGLYTLRIIAGAAATLIEPSFWLLAFSIFIFLSLGIVKRYSELDDVRRLSKSGGHGRGYSSDDLMLLMGLGTASGFCSIVVIALYINSSDSQALYKHSQALWLICPLLLYWISRVWLITTRGQMEDDPVVFAVRDKISLSVLGLAVLLVYLSI